MPVAISADGKRHVFPDGTAPDVIDRTMKDYASQSGGTQKPEATDGQIKSWSDVPMQAIKNIPSSTGKLISDTIHPILHPLATAQSFYDIGKGLVSKGARAAGFQGNVSDEAAANAIGEFFKNRYGSWNNFRNTLATDPAGVVADAATILTGGEAALARAPGAVGELGRAAGAVGRAVDPIANVARIAKPVAKAVAMKGIEPVLSHALGVNTGVGAKSIQEGAKSAYAGNPAFEANLRGQVSPTQVVDMAKRAIHKMGQERRQAYRSGMLGVTNDKSVLDFLDINKAVDDAKNMVYFEDTPKSAEAANTYNQIKGLIDEWQNKPARVVNGNIEWPHRTVEGLDALKQAIGEVKSGTEQGSLSRKVSEQIYNSVKDEITKQAPDYARVMKDYHDASETMDQLSRTFSLGEKSLPDTALRKLQSIMRNDVTTNYGARVKLADVLSKYEPDLIPSLAGQALSSREPRGLARTGAFMEALYALHNPLTGVPMLATSIPRVVGEGANLAGKAAKRLKGAPSIGHGVGLGMYQTGRTADEAQNTSPDISPEYVAKQLGIQQ